MNMFKTKKQLNVAVDTARRAAKKTAKQAGYNLIRERKTLVSTFDDQGEQCQPSPESEGNVWYATVAQIQQLSFRVGQDYPDVAAIALTGGFDGTDEQEIVDSWISEWRVDVWLKSKEEER